MRVPSRVAFLFGFFALMVALQLAVVLSRGTRQFWSMEPGSAVDWSLAATPLVAACLAGVSCYAAQASVPTRAPRETLVQVHGARLVLFAAWPGFVGAVLASALSIVVSLALVWRARGDVPVPHTIGLILVAIAMYASAAVVGACLGILLRGPLMPFLLTIAGVLSFFISRSLRIDRLVRIGGSTGSVSDFEIRWLTLWIWCAALLLIAGIAAVTVVHVSGAHSLLSKRPAAIATVAALLVGVVSLSMGAGGQGHVYALMTSFPNKCATHEDLTVCARDDSAFDPEATARAFGPYADTMHSLANSPRISKWGVVSIPDRVPPGAGILVANSMGETVPLAYEMSQSAVAGRGCPSLGADTKYTSVLTIAGEWVAFHATGRPTPGLSSAQLTWLHSPSSRAWTAAATEAVRDCDVGRVEAPQGWETEKTGLAW